jgi:hypothetical protein
MNEILIGVSALITAITTAVATYWGIQSKNKDRQVRGLKKAAASYVPRELQFLSHWGSFERKLKKILEETEVDRFILFRCWNGVDDPMWTTAIYQFREGGQEWFNYYLVPLDADYQKRIRNMKADGVHAVKVDDIPQSMIKTVYEGEGVCYSMWYHVCSDPSEGTDHVAHTYFSAATHENVEDFDEHTKAKLQDLAWDLSRILNEV